MCCIQSRKHYLHGGQPTNFYGSIPPTHQSGRVALPLSQSISPTLSDVDKAMERHLRDSDTNQFCTLPALGRNAFTESTEISLLSNLVYRLLLSLLLLLLLLLLIWCLVFI